MCIQQLPRTYRKIGSEIYKLTNLLITYNNYQLHVNLGHQFHLASTVFEKDDTTLLSSDISGNIDLPGKSQTFSSF
jgi:hypothetical protein